MFGVMTVSRGPSASEVATHKQLLEKMENDGQHHGSTLKMVEEVFPVTVQKVSTGNIHSILQDCPYLEHVSILVPKLNDSMPFQVILS